MQLYELDLDFVEPLTRVGRSAGLPAGYTARMAHMKDAEAVVEALNAIEFADTGERLLSKEAMVVEWTAPDFGPEEDVHLVFAPGGALAGYVELWCGDPYVHAHIFGRVHPGHRDLGIGKYLIDWAERRARQGMEQAPLDARLYVRTSAISTNSAAHRLFEQCGFGPVRHFYRMALEMPPETPPPAPTWPAGIRMRTFVRGQDERPTYDVIKEAFRDHWGFVDGDDFGEWLHWFENNPKLDPSLIFLAVAEDGQIAGLALCQEEAYSDPDMGWVDDLGVLRAWRRKGVATALLHQAFGEFHRRGKYRVGLGVDASNLTGATRLYESVGMQVCQRKDVYEKVLRDGRDLSTQTLEEQDA